MSRIQKRASENIQLELRYGKEATDEIGAGCGVFGGARRVSLSPIDNTPHASKHAASGLDFLWCFFFISQLKLNIFISSFLYSSHESKRNIELQGIGSERSLKAWKYCAKTVF